MQQNYQSTKLPTAASQVASSGGASWANPSNITADDGSSATLAYTIGGDYGAAITGESFDLPKLPDAAVIDGIGVQIEGTNVGCHGDVQLNISGSETKDMGALNGNFGGATDLWGLTEITIADIEALEVTVVTGDVSGGDGTASIDYMSVTVFWHIEEVAPESDVATRIDYKVFSREGNYLGLLPNVTSKLGYPEDINAAGASVVITCGKFVDNPVTVTPLLTESGDVITTEDDRPIVATATELQVTTGDSPDEAMFKNSNRIKAWLYNKYYPRGKLVFSGQVNRVNFKYGGGDATVKLTVYSDGLDLNNFIARGYPVNYTTDQSMTTDDGATRVELYAPSKGAGWTRYGQTFKTGAGVTNVGAITVKLRYTALVTMYLYDAPNGNLLGSVSKNISNASMTSEKFEFPTLIPVEPETEYFFALGVDVGTVRMRSNTGNLYADGEIYEAVYSGGSGGGLFMPYGGDLYFITEYGTPDTTTTYTEDDPTSDMASGILLDYNARGGLITERDFEATGLSLTYTFVVAFVFAALQKILELCPSGFYLYVDVGTAEMDIKQVSATADFTVVKGRHINELNVDLTIEQVKNYLLLTGGDTGGGENLYRKYQDTVSTSNFGLRTSTRADNRVTLDATADAIGDTFIEESADEVQETMLTVLNEHIDITLLTPGKTIGFKNFGNFIDDMILQIVRREINHNDGVATLTLGRLPVRMNDEIQRLNRELTNEQTINNPSSPS